MLLSIALILLCGMSMSWICKKLKLPGLLGMLLTGIVLGPYVLNLLDENLLNISSELRKMALIIILMRAGLGLDISGLKKIGRPAVMMCFVPASFELLGMLVLAPRLLGLSAAGSGNIRICTCGGFTGGCRAAYGKIDGRRLWNGKRNPTVDSCGRFGR